MDDLKLKNSVADITTMPPEMMVDKIANNTKELSQYAPNMTPHVQSTAFKAMNTINEAIPRRQDIMPGDMEYKPNREQKHKLTQTNKLVHDPVAILDHVKNGTLRKSHMDVMTNVYPNMLKEMQMKVAEQLTKENIKKLSYSKKIAISKFLGQPIDRSLTQQNMMRNNISKQASNQAKLNQQQAQQPKQKSTLGGLKELKVASRSETETQQIEKKV